MRDLTQSDTYLTASQILTSVIFSISSRRPNISQGQSDNKHSPQRQQQEAHALKHPSLISHLISIISSPIEKKGKSQK